MHIRKTLVAAASLGFLLCPSPVFGQARQTFLTGEVLYSRLQDYRAPQIRDIVTATMAFGYVVGVHDAYNGERQRAGCFGTRPGVTQLQVIDAVLKWLAENPQHRQHSADGLVTAALVAAYPCDERGFRITPN
jgi:hypothetical protein